MGKDVVVHGATLKCSESVEKSFLKARNVDMEVDGNYVATVADHEPTENILPFGICKHPKWKNKPCKPVTPSPWEPGEKSVEFGNQRILDVKSKCECKIGGTIEIVDPGQSHPFLFVDCEGYSPAALKISALKQRAALIKEQMDAENEAEAGQRSLLNQLANTALETGKEFSGYNDAGRALDALRRGDLKGAAWHTLLATPFKPVKAVGVTSDLLKARKRAGLIKGHTSHGIHQSISRNGGAGVKAAAKLDAVRSPVKTIPQSDGSTKYVGKEAVVVLNKEGKVITTWGKSRGPAIDKSGKNKGNKAQRRAQKLGRPYDPKDIR